MIKWPRTAGKKKRKVAVEKNQVLVFDRLSWLPSNSFQPYSSHASSLQTLILTSSCFSGGLGNTRFTVGLYELKGLFQPQWLHDLYYNKCTHTPLLSVLKSAAAEASNQYLGKPCISNKLPQSIFTSPRIKPRSFYRQRENKKRC